MYFGSGHLRTRAAMAEWLNAPVLETEDVGSILCLAIALITVITY